MKLLRRGKCVVCQLPCNEEKEFIETIDMFNTITKPTLSYEILKDIRKWRNSALYCINHTEGSNS